MLGRFLLPSAPHATVLEVSIEEALNDEQAAVEKTSTDEEEKSFKVVFTYQSGKSSVDPFISYILYLCLHFSINQSLSSANFIFLSNKNNI